jgi:hypothetical protein
VKFTRLGSRLRLVLAGLTLVWAFKGFRLLLAIGVSAHEQTNVNVATSCSATKCYLALKYDEGLISGTGTITDSASFSNMPRYSKVAARRHSPRALLICGMCAKVEISDQYAMTPTLRIAARAISNVKRDGRL